MVAVAGLDHEARPRSGSLSTTCADFSDLSRLLERTRLRFSPAFDARAVADRFFAAEASDAEATARRLAYVALTRARDTLVLEWPEPTVQKALAQPTDPCFSAAGLLAVRCGMSVDAGGIRLDGTTHSARVSFCGKTMPPEFDTPPTLSAPALPRLGRRAVVPCVARPDGGPARLVPSLLELPVDPPPPVLTTQDLDAPCVPGSGRSWDSATERGTALHEAMRVLLIRPDLAPRLPARLGLGEEEVLSFARRAEALRAWLTGQGFTQITTEVPADVVLAGGARLSATFDLLAEGEAGLALVDHKSDAETDFEAGFLRHWPQLSAYLAGLRTFQAPERPVLVGIHWIGRGRITFGRV